LAVASCFLAGDEEGKNGGMCHHRSPLKFRIGCEFQDGARPKKTDNMS
jgi:hypothetical protein